MNAKRLLEWPSLVAITATVFLMVGCAKDMDSTTNNADPQQKIDRVVDSVRLALESDIGEIIPNLNIYIQTPKGAWFASSAGQGYQCITADTYFRFASNTKPFTCTAILNMQEDGWLDINDKITDTIPGSNIPYVPATSSWNIPNKSEITIKMLLQHSAGVYDVDNDSVPGYNGKSYTSYMMDLDLNHQFTAEQMVGQAALHQLSYFAPGTGHHYSNTGFVILCEIVGRIYSFKSGSQKHLTDYLHDKVYGLGTPVPINAHFPNLSSDKDLPTPFSCGHDLLGSGKVDEYCSYNMTGQIGEGNGYATIRDLNTFIRTLIKGQNVLTPASVNLMTTELSPGSSDYFLGCIYVPNLGYGHNGLRIGNLSLMVYDPVSDVSVISYIDAVYRPDFVKTMWAIYDVAWATRSALGYPGKPLK